MKKCIYLLFLWAVFLPFICYGQIEVIDPNNISDPLLLKVAAEKILDAKERHNIIYNRETGSSTDLGLMKVYAYTEDVLENKENIVNENTRQISFYTIQVYAGKPFYNNNGNWELVRIATTTIDAFNIQVSPTIQEKFVGFFKIQEVTAGTYTLSDGNGEVSHDGGESTWDAWRDATSGTVNQLSYIHAYTEWYTNNKYYGSRGFLPFDVSAIPLDATLGTSSIFIWPTAKYDNDNDGNDYIAMTDNTQASADSLSTNDFDNIDNTEFSEQIDIGSISTGSYTEFALNEDGINNINPGSTAMYAVREGHDILDDPIASGGGDSQTGIQLDRTTHYPYMIINYTVPEATSTATSTQYVYSGFNINNIAIITGLSTTTAEGILTYYHIPFIPIIFITIIFLFITNRLVIEFLIRWRK